VPKNTVGNLYYSGWGGWTLDFDNTAYLLYHTKQFWNPCYSNPKLDALLEQERATYDQSQREQILQQVAQIEHDDLIDLPLYQSKNLWGVSDRVQGFVAPADDRNDLTNVSVSN
jgi:peptide/nickel transport system substrate-binding protein